jgi:hypothetical protein
MRHLLPFVAAVALFFGTGTAASAQNLIMNDDFETPGPSDPEFVKNDLNGGNPGTFGTWFDLSDSGNGRGFFRNDNGQGGAGDHFAQHIVNDGVNHTNQIFQGFDASTIPGGSLLLIEFDYICSQDEPNPDKTCTNRRLIVRGLDSDDIWTRFLLSGNECRQQPGNGPLCDVLIEKVLDPTNTWQRMSVIVPVPRVYSAIGVGFLLAANRNDLGGGVYPPQGTRGVDNVSVRVLPNIEKTLTSGPLDDYGAAIPVDVNPFDDGGILIGHDESQHFKFVITADGPDNTGWKLFDVVPAEYDPDPDAEDGSLDMTTGACPDTVCDGIEVTEGDCTATINPHDGNRKLDPHFIRIALGTEDACEVTVWVKTSENPASAKGNKDTQFEPTSCDVVMENGMTIYNTITLNEGVKLFDPDEGIRVLGPVGSLQLTCNQPY